MQFIKIYLEFGPKVHQLKQRPNRKVTYRIDISSVVDLYKLCQLIDRTDSLQGNKLRQYEAWKNRFNI